MKVGTAICVLAVMLFIDGTATNVLARQGRSNFENVTASISRCSQATALLHALATELHQKGAQEFFVDDPSPPPYTAHLEGGWNGRSPEKSLLNAWSKRQPRSILGCLRSETFDGRPIISSADENRMRAERDGINSPEMFIRISAPVFDRSATHALLLYVSQGVSIGGHAEAYHLQQSRHGWKIIGRSVLWVS